MDKLISNGFEVRPVVTGNFTKQPVINLLNVNLSENLPNANYLHENSLFIGNHHYDMQEGLDNLARIII